MVLSDFFMWLKDKGNYITSDFTQHHAMTKASFKEVLDKAKVCIIINFQLLHQKNQGKFPFIHYLGMKANPMQQWSAYDLHMHQCTQGGM